MRLTSRSTALPIVIAVAWGACPRPGHAGDLNPPPGPVTSTMKTLSEIEPRTAISALPFTCTTPGSYYLTGNLTGVTGQNGVLILASDVTLDLNGFQLVGVPGSLNGIAVSAAQVNIAVRNGTIRDWGAAGLDASLASNCHLEALRAYNNAGEGLHVDQGSTVVNCLARANGLAGITAGNGSTVRGCAARNNVGDGIKTGSGCTVTSSAARNNDDGIQTGANSTVRGCTASVNDDDGIAVGIGSTVIGCTAAQNDGNGVQADAGSTVRDCAVNLNGASGILVTGGCLVAGNACDSNGQITAGAGIHASADANRIDGNHVTAGPLGIDVDGLGNVIVRNSATGNGTNYSIVGGNKVGTLRSDPTTAGPWDNFDF